MGELQAYMVDRASGRMAYAVLSFGGLLGMGNKLLALRWPALTLDTVNNCFTLTVTKDKLQRSPGFDQHMWASITGKAWATG